MNFLFGHPLWVLDNLLSQEKIDSLMGQIYRDIDYGFEKPDVNCNCKTSIHREDNVDYPIDDFKRAYEQFSSEINLTCHEYYISCPWYNHYHIGTGQEPHVHVGSGPNYALFSAVYFVQGCEDKELIFMNPSQIHLYYAKILDQFVRDDEMQHSSFFGSHWFKPKDNQLIIFPSTLEHYVPYQKQSEPRTTISFNIRTGDD